jgi:hypothetical protein
MIAARWKYRLKMCCRRNIPGGQQESKSAERKSGTALRRPLLNANVDFQQL